MEEFDRFYRINVLGTMHCVKTVGAAMCQQAPLTVQGRTGERNVGRGAIVNLGSANSYIATRDMVQATASKHAVLGITRNAGPFSPLDLITFYPTLLPSSLVDFH